MTLFSIYILEKKCSKSEKFYFMSNHLSAYRTLILDNGMKAEKHKVLFDTGAQVNIISEQHSILDEVIIYSKGQLKVK